MMGVFIFFAVLELKIDAMDNEQDQSGLLLIYSALFVPWVLFGANLGVFHSGYLLVYIGQVAGFYPQPCAFLSSSAM